MFPYGIRKRGGYFLPILLGVLVGGCVGYFSDIYVTETFYFFRYKSIMIGITTGVITALFVSGITRMYRY